MDALLRGVPIRRKTRVHFHAFMRDVHEELRARSRHEDDPLATVAGAHRAPPAADLLRRVPRLRHRRRDDPRPAADRAVRARRRLRDDVELPARRRSTRTACSARTSCRRSRCSSNGSTWSRSTAASTTGCARWSRSGAYYTPLGAAADAALAARFERDAPRARTRIRGSSIEGRTLRRATRAGQRSSGSISRRCATGRARSSTTSSWRGVSRWSSLSDVPRLTPDMGDRARRFTWLVDVLYDHRVKLLLSAAVAGRTISIATGRTARSSRAPSAGSIEMQHPRIHGAAAPGGRRRPRLSRSASTSHRRRTLPDAEIQGLPDVPGRQRRVEPLRRDDAGRARSGRRRRHAPSIRRSTTRTRCRTTAPARSCASIRPSPASTWPGRSRRPPIRA